MSVDQKRLLADCQRQLKLLEADLKAQATALPDLAAALRAEYEAGREAGRVGDAFEMWSGEQATQAAVHWVLGGVFVRFLEDNGLIDSLIAGAGDRGRMAEDAEQAFYAAHPTLHARDWLLRAFRTVAALPGGAALFDEAHNPAFRWPLSPDAAQALVRFWRRPDPETGGLVHDFTDPAWDTRFLGDLYQDLSEGARKKYALLQTPVFVEEFILDRTLGEALKALPLPKVTVIDPTIGSGHFALGAFVRLLAAWEAKEPGALREDLAQRALDQVAGVDLNPFAAAIARFRLLIAALRACGVTRLERAPQFRVHVVVGDSLLHGDPQVELALGDEATRRRLAHAFSDEDLAAVNAVLSQAYTVVVGNPPYIAVKDKALNQAYRARYTSCHRKYQLSAPFVERFWQLATCARADVPGGWVGMINSNAFMKRAFGAKLVEEFFPTQDLTHVIDTAGAYIPGHGTPTVILFGRHRGPTTPTVRVAMGIRGEPQTPTDASQGLVWSAIITQLDEPGSESDYISVSDVPRTSLVRHPWNIGGGGAAELKELIDEAGTERVGDLADSVGFGAILGEDDAFAIPASSAARLRLPQPHRQLVVGDELRDWSLAPTQLVLFPYDDNVQLIDSRRIRDWTWPLRTLLATRQTFGKRTFAEAGVPYWSFHQIPVARNLPGASLAFAAVATHNHFVVKHGRAVFNRSAPVVRPASDVQLSRLMSIAALLNSSTACFWFKQVLHNKGSTVDQHGARQRTAPFEDFFEFSCGAVEDFPIPSTMLDDAGQRLSDLAEARRSSLPRAVVASNQPTRAVLNSARLYAQEQLGQMISLQEEVDWRCYYGYGIVADDLTYRSTTEVTTDPPPLELGQRAFEIVLARRMAAGEEDSTWFVRHGSTPITELPAHWPADYRAVVERRIAAIESNRSVNLIERAEYKRRWNLELWESLEREALSAWLLDRLERPGYWPAVKFQTTRDVAERAALDPDFVRVAELWAGAEGVALEPVIRELILGEAVPFLPALRYSESGLEKRAVWERTWELQRAEDTMDAAVAAELSKRDGESDDAFAKRLAAAQRARREAEIDPIPRPPKYASKDFQQAVYWRMRGALDVPKERFILYPFCNHDGDDAPLLGWAGWSHLQQAEALTAWYADRTQLDGWQGDRVIPMLAGMAELVPWLLQWHNDLDPVHGDRPGETYASWLDTELQAQGLTRDDLRTWEVPRAPRRGGRRGAAPRPTAAADAAE